MNILLDTCAVIWAIVDPTRIPPYTQEVLEQDRVAIHVSPISVAEIACAVERGRLTVQEHWKPWLHRNCAENGWEFLQIGLDIMEEAYSLPGTFHADPADRIVVATARFHRLKLVTGDKKILSYPHVDCLWK